MPDTSTATLDASADAVREAALRADAGEYDDSNDAGITETDTQTSPETDGQPAEKGRDADTDTSETETQKPAAKPEAKPAQDKSQTTKPESAYTKAAKDKARLDTSWKKLTEEKEAYRQQVAQFERERAEFLNQRQQAQTPQPAAKPEDDPDILDTLAKRYRAEGNEEMAQAATAKADRIREAAKTQPQQQAPAAKGPDDHINDPRFQAEWKRHVADLVKDNPTLTDPTDPIGRATMGLANHQHYGRFFRSFPDGLKVAHEVALLQRDAAQLKPLREELTKAKAEVDRLTKLTSLRGAPPPSGSGRGKQSLADLSGDAAEDFVRKAAMEADRGESN